MNDYHNVSSETEKIREDAAILASDLAEMKKLDILRQANIDRLKKMKDHIDVLKEEDKSNKEKGIVREAEDQARVLKLYEGYNKEKEEVESRYTEARNLLIETQAAAALVLEAKRQKENEELEAQAATFRLERLQNESNEELEIRIKQAQKEKELADYKMELLNQGFAAVSQGLDAQSSALGFSFNSPLYNEASAQTSDVFGGPAFVIESHFAADVVASPGLVAAGEGVREEEEPVPPPVSVPVPVPVPVVPVSVVPVVVVVVVSVVVPLVVPLVVPISDEGEGALPVPVPVLVPMPLVVPVVVLLVVPLSSFSSQQAAASVPTQGSDAQSI